MNSELPTAEHHRRALDRVIFLSDGVMAISMTLLVLDLRLPPLAESSSAALRDALRSSLSHFISFSISFYVIAMFWLAHLRIFSLIAIYTRGLAFRNLVFLMSIAIMPFSTTLAGEYGSLTLATVLYSASVVFTSATSALLWFYASRRGRLLDPAVSRADVSAVSTRAVVVLAVFTFATGIAFVSIGIARAAWIATPFVTRIAERIARRRGAR